VQTSLKLAVGSALASIGLTIPAAAAASVLLEMPLQLGLGAKDLVLVLTFVIGSITFASGRTHMMQGAIHLVVFAAFLFLALVPLPAGAC
jgi:Ca2+:H+ antiporter